MGLGIGAIVLFLGGAGAVLYAANRSKQELIYFLYMRTFLGRMHHANNVRTARTLGRKVNLSRPEFNVETRGSLVRIVPYLADNYAYIVMCKATKTCAVVDPGDPHAVIEGLGSIEKDYGHAVSVSTVLTTHYHHDHASGNVEFAQLVQGRFTPQETKLNVVGSATEPSVHGANNFVRHGDQIQVGELVFETLEVPCHTNGSVLFVNRNERLLFTGDFLFSAGAGKFFEGGARDFAKSISRSVDPLEDDYLVFPGHEYTVSNLAFAQRVMPEDPSVGGRLEQAKAQRENDGAPTIPSRLGDERHYNLFLRALHPGNEPLLTARIKELVETNAPVRVASGSDKKKDNPAIVLGAGSKGEDFVRALRALKDKGV